MTRIQLVLPGEHRPSPTHLVGGYKITVERADGVACEEQEALNALGMYAFSHGWRIPAGSEETPNAETLASMRELEEGHGIKTSIDEIRAILRGEAD